MSLTVRLTPRIERALNEAAKHRRQTRSDVVREAIEQFAAVNGAGVPDSGPYQQWADVIGVVRLGARKPNKTTGDLFADLVTGKARARRAR